jgi:hypothetical protein
MLAGGYVTGGVVCFLVLLRSANAAVLRTDTATGVMPLVASCALDRFWFCLNYGYCYRGS